MPFTPRIIVLTAPSGAGKSTIARRLLRAMPNVRFSVSATTRTPRTTETPGVHYHFMSNAEFDRGVRDRRFIEYEEVYPGLRYGTLVSEVDSADTRNPVLLDIDVRGARRVKEIFGDDALTIFIAPPSFDELAARLTGRATETGDALRTRLERARDEMAWAGRFDFVVLNRDVEDATDEVMEVVRGFLEGEKGEGKGRREREKGGG